jgi:hypothetical protein
MPERTTSDDHDRFNAWTAVEEDSGGVAKQEGRRFAGVVFWRRHRPSLGGRRAVLELTDRPEAMATLTDSRGRELFSVPIGEIDCRRSWPRCFTIECEGRRWRLCGLAVNSVNGAKRQLEFMRKEHVLTVVPRPPAMSDKAYKQLMISKLGQERLWRELWLIALRDFGAREVGQSRGPVGAAGPVLDERPEIMP